MEDRPRLRVGTGLSANVRTALAMVTIPLRGTVAPVTTGGGPGTSGSVAGRRQTSATGDRRLSGLDGLRALAVLLVLGFHFGVPDLDGGFLGVDVFFVLSGFLITGLLLGDHDRHGHVDPPSFWLRRARRLLPALVVVVVAVTIAVRTLEPPGHFSDFRMDALSALFYFSNWWQISSSGHYFAAAAPVSPLVHTWSLAVEEQFYLVWPLVVLVCCRARTRRRRTVAVLCVSAAGAIGSAVDMAVRYRPAGSVTPLYFGTDTHAESVMIGATVACLLTLVQQARGESGMDPIAHSARGRAVLGLAGVAGAAGLLLLSWRLEGSSSLTYRGGIAIAGLCSAVLVVSVVAVPSGPLGRVLSLRPAVALGTISYGVYLWHFPVGVFLDHGRTGLGGFPLFAARTATTLLLASASWVLIERPVLEGSFWRSLRAALPTAATVAVAVAVVFGATSGDPPVAAPGLTGGPAQAARWRAVRIASFAGAGNRTRVLIVGDSLALTVAVGMAPYAAAYGIDLGGRSHTGCGVALALPLDDHGEVGDPFPNCATWPTWWADDVAQLHPQVVGLVIGFWEVVDRWFRGRWQHLGDPAFDAYEQAQLERAVTVLGSTGAKVALFTAPYFHTGEQPDGTPWPQDDPARVDRLNAIIGTVAARFPEEVRVLPLHAVLDPGGRFTWTIGGQVVRQQDGVHTTVAAGPLLARRLLPGLASLAGTG